MKGDESIHLKELKRVSVRMQWGVKIPLRDGIHLNATLYVPVEHASVSPVIFTLTPYVAQTSHDVAVYFAAHGYAFLTIDVRGRGNSEGLFKADAQEAKDAHDVIEWLAQQPYCDGSVAMWGGSYAGYVQWAAAREFPAHLATIVPVASPFRGVDSPAPNNIFAPYRIQWLNLLAGRAAQEKIFADQAFWSEQFKRWFQSGTPLKQIDAFLGNPSPIFQEWICHPQRDEYWDSYNPTAQQYAEIDLPILTITGVYDTNQLGALMHYREHLQKCSAAARERHYLVIGPWDHAGTRIPKAEFGGIKVGPAGLIDLARLHLQWYGWTMRGGPKPAFLRKNIAYYVMGAEKWRYADAIEEITARSEPLYLHSLVNPVDVLTSGSLTVEPPAQSEPDQYIYDPRDVSLAEVESTVDPGSWVDQRMIYSSIGKQLVYHSAPFERDTEISGFFRLCVWLSIDQPDTDFCVSISEIAIDGGAMQLTADCLRARYRESSREQKLIETRAPLRYQFERFAFVSRLVCKGHRLRMTIGPLNSIFWQKNYNSGGAVCDESMHDARTVTVRLFHDGLHPSALYIPVGKPESADA